MRTASAFALFVATLPQNPGLAAQAAPSTPPVPSYIVADRGGAEQMLGAARADEVFSDQFTPLRKRLVAASLRANPAPGCAQPPEFTLEVVAPIEANAPPRPGRSAT